MGSGGTLTLCELELKLAAHIRVPATVDSRSSSLPIGVRCGMTREAATRASIDCQADVYVTMAHPQKLQTLLQFSATVFSAPFSGSAHKIPSRRSNIMREFPARACQALKPTVGCRNISRPLFTRLQENQLFYVLMCFRKAHNLHIPRQLC